MNLIKEKDYIGFVKLQITLSKYPSEVRKAIFKGLLKAAKRKIVERKKKLETIKFFEEYEGFID